MNILGLSFGRKMGNTDILVKEALYGAKEAALNANIRFINTVKLEIGRCIGCGACSDSLSKGGDNNCIVKDDFDYVEEAIRQADVIIVGAPVYVLQPVGQFKNVVDRFSCRHDNAAIEYQMERRRKGEVDAPAVFPEERLKQRYVSYISVGGASTDDWVSMGTASMHLFGFPNLMKTIGNMDVHHMGTTGNPVLNRELMNNVHEMGRQTVQAYGKPLEEIKWFGDEGTCPVCHQNLMLLSKTTKVTCPICGIHGTLSIEKDEVKVTFSNEQKARARGTFAGNKEHTDEIQNFGIIAEPKMKKVKDELPRMLEKYKNFETCILEN
ncbi:flavodoxin family protein [Anaerosacchariphilus polymeriproducens]|uniref:Flavodoxin family protein n=1 Tax=Anaerosacchariphilus polymeriproducens TaxID=1812858 RepID=A0A371AYG0_9FIRM|nr:flavodoxin family protein [Anaerosacchariphilus polymeriproducens]RDU24628.1 flavodoxin family protein [Anaerosacchariphilus polymeriproducens]